MLKLTYRPEIDGLRAFAVLGVLIYHADIHWGGKLLVSGGYLGVDVFFVISGYLITSIIYTQLSEHRFSLLHFYERRARRLLPVLMTVILISAAVGWFTLMPSGYEDFNFQVLTSLVFSSNIYFWLEDPYWATESALKPLLHTWSLSVEEQFYLFMPAVIFVLLKLSRRALVPVLILAAVVSLAYAQMQAEADPIGNFYLLPSRVWELSAGAIVAVLHREGRWLDFRPQVSSIMLGVGLLTILVSYLLFDQDTPHPSLWTLAPIFGTLLIVTASSASGPVGFLLASKPVNYVGRLSYSLYIWHFPIFAFSRIYLGQELSPLVALALLALAFMLSVLSYHFIEQPMRSAQTMPRRPFWLVAAGSSALLVVIALAGLNLNLARFPEQERVFFSQYNVTAREREKERLLALDALHDGDRPKILVLGDSHGSSMFLLLGSDPDVTQRYDVDLMTINTSFNPNIEGQTCTEQTDRTRLSNVGLKDYEKIIISERYFESIWDMQSKCLENALELIVAENPNLYLVLPQLLVANNPNMNRDLPDHLSLAVRLYLEGRPDVYAWEAAAAGLGRQRRYERATFQDYTLYMAGLRTLMSRMADQYGMSLLDPFDFQCNLATRRCPLTDRDNNPLFVDRHHVSVFGVKYYTRRFDFLQWIESAAPDSSEASG